MDRSEKMKRARGLEDFGVTGRTDFAPPVNDFFGERYALVGGRLDYIYRRAVDALAYRHRRHLTWKRQLDG